MTRAPLATGVLGLVTLASVITGCTGSPAMNPSGGTPAPASTGASGPADPSATSPAAVAPSRNEVVAILADYDKRNNDSIVNGADWKGSDGGTPLTRDRYVDAL